MTEIGARVGAISHTDDDGKVYFFGFGTYQGTAVPEEAVGWMAEAAREVGLKNPKIVLDNGEVVYGCECWWGAEERVKEQLANKEVVPVSIGDQRQKYVEENGV
jgi:hypothetical protein